MTVLDRVAVVGDDGYVNCDVAREALSARLDGERESVPAARVDQHVNSCRQCQAWLALVDAQAHQMGELRAPRDRSKAILDSVPSAAGPAAWVRAHGMTVALVALGVVQVVLALAQLAGVHFGMTDGGHSPTSGDHLMNESTAWSIALGATTIAAAYRRALLPGLAVVLGVFVVLLFGFVVHDALTSDVTWTRGVSHLPVLAAFVCVVAAVRTRRRRPDPATNVTSVDATPSRTLGL
ncbi:zf-HC2 domain-containing protein [Williamsia sp. CHRR-6]|uniref:zf-HC2 domain-containing protein n=1 Tax=Williamsia sp. CHRR-6 TaxID=2835871 RepID=UPI001BDA23F1|nr:zf-HC2 domain-containing protein [Williamsia sp. CHRR-6]MBT0567849.1 zf-HC2 domain-containing protein [Williamsia sp. CHRR-6]